MKRKLQVFVSSTYTDLLEERQAAVSAILKAGHIPAGMELFTAGDKSQLDTIYRWIDESDVYMLILGGRYGSLDPKTNLSYTELEYNYAVDTEKPLFSVVIDEAYLDEKVKDQGRSVLESSFPKELERFRGEVLTRISSFFSDPRDIKLCVHETLSDFSDSRELSGWVPYSEIPSTAPLLEEIDFLKSQNHELNEKLTSFERAQANIDSSRKQQYRFEELEELLRKIIVEIPSSIRAVGTPKHLALLELFILYSGHLANGVFNKAGMSSDENFVFYNVCPRLKVHGLVANEKVTGVRYRRYSTTKLGDSFLAYLQKKEVLEVTGSAPKETEDEKNTIAESVVDTTADQP